MKIAFTIFTSALLLSAAMQAGAPVIKDLPKSNQLAFTENKGQVHDQNSQSRPDVLFGAKKGNLNFHFFKDGISYQFSKVTFSKDKLIHNRNSKHKFNKASSITTQRIDLKWLNTLSTARVEAEQKNSDYSNYINAMGEFYFVASYGSLWYRNLYSGVDLHYYEKDNKLKYDLIVSASGDYKQIKLQVSGVEKISITKAGSLLLKTALGTVQEDAPIVFEDGKQLQARWILEGNVLSFDITGHKEGHTLIIDPTTRLWGTYYGGANDEPFFNCSSDAALNAYAVGLTEAGTGTIIATTGSYQNTFGGGTYDGLIVKFNSAGVRQWATYYGGTGDDIITGCASDANGNLYVSGSIDGISGSVFTSPGCYQSTFGGNYDIFLARFSTAGLRLWGTYYGDTSDDQTMNVSVDASGNALVAGYTDASSGSVLTSSGAYQTTPGGSYDALLVKFDNTGNRLWATFYGDSGDDLFNYCSADASGNVFACGVTDSQSGIATAGAFQTTQGGGYDAFAVKFNSTGARQWASYYGDSGDEFAYMSACDANGNFIFAGDTDSPTGLGTTGAHQASNGGGNNDAFVVSFSTGGTRNWGTYYGANSYDDCFALSVDAAGNAILAGTSDLSTGSAIASPGSWQTSNGGGSDAYIAKFNSTGQRIWGTYYGGSGDEVGYCAGMANNDTYLAGYTDSNNNIASSGSHQSTFGGAFDGFLSKFNSCTAPNAPTNISPASAMNACSNKFNLLTANGAGVIAWYNAASSGSLLATGTTFSIGNTSPGTYTVYLESQECANSASRTAVVYTVNAAPTISVAIPKTSICRGENYSINVSGATTYSWNTGSTNSVVALNPTVTTQYTVTGFSGVCSDRSSFTLTVNACAGIYESKAGTAVSVFPNPNKGEFYLTASQDAEISITNVVGQVVYKGKVLPGKNNLQLQLETGMYLIRVENSDTADVVKFIVE